MLSSLGCPGFDPSHADLFSHNELLINAPCERIWSHIIDAPKWPEWYPNSKEVKITGDTVLKDGTAFRWTTFGLAARKQGERVHPLHPHRLVRGYAPGTAPSFYHTRYLKPRGVMAWAARSSVLTCTIKGRFSDPSFTMKFASLTHDSSNSRSSLLRSRINPSFAPTMASARSRLVLCSSSTFSSTVPRAMRR
jgi:hypothetical protein